VLRNDFPLWAIPEGLIAEIRRNAVRYREEDLRAVPWQAVLDPKLSPCRLRALRDEAADFVSRMPTEKIGFVFLKDGKVGQPDPAHLNNYPTHAGQRRGHWPTSMEISASMLEYYQKNRPHP